MPFVGGDPDSRSATLYFTAHSATLLLSLVKIKSIS